MPDGQAPLIAAVSGKSPERVLAWSDPETFTLRRDHKVVSAGYKIVIAEQAVKPLRMVTLWSLI